MVFARLYYHGNRRRPADIISAELNAISSLRYEASGEQKVAKREKRHTK